LPISHWELYRFRAGIRTDRKIPFVRSTNGIFRSAISVGLAFVNRMDTSSTPIAVTGYGRSCPMKPDANERRRSLVSVGASLAVFGGTRRIYTGNCRLKRQSLVRFFQFSLPSQRKPKKPASRFRCLVQRIRGCYRSIPAGVAHCNDKWLHLTVPKSPKSIPNRCVHTCTHLVH